MMSSTIKYIAAAAAAMAAMPGFAQAQAQDKRFAVEGPGILTCSDFLAAQEDKRSLEYQRFIGFAEGYLSAANLYEPNTFDLSPWHNAAAFDLILGTHCQQNESELITNVLQRMVSSFRPLRVAEFSPMLEVGNGEYRAFVYETILRRAQAALTQLGFYAGPEDAQYSPALKDGFLKFQRARELLETGVPDPVTLWTLLNP
ncbi:peptidoglycan-binding protein [Erythrobacter insulae]|uniref:Peptidoglycan-binding protein n=1 Tax=Erythrobacter insulae TaxID=2584124 RepID=A0A547PC46_9SPHN|nr:peptidoglycan-binding domain-containing protein [Erythrobacter insulae]TRD11604.1 peptidoglycan-binding protein [Erythrobacter insulae]